MTARSEARDLTPWLTEDREEWLLDVTRWISETVESLGLGLAEITSLRERPWGVVLRVTTSDGVLYFKAEGLGGWHEPAVLRDLAGPWSELVPDVVAFDDERSWMLMADHGQPMWDVLDPMEQLSVFEAILPLYAEMQHASGSSVQRWIDLGAPDRRMTNMTDLLQRLLAGEFYGGALPIGPELRRAIDAALPTLEEACAGLATTSFADALDHGDLHGGNVLVGAGSPRLVDWGDSCVTHPFSSLFVTYQLAFAKGPLDDRLAGALRLRDVYLEPWTEYGSAVSLRASFSSALWIAHVSRALDFVHMLDGSTPELVVEWHGYIVELLDQWQQRRELLGRDDDLVEAIFA